MRTIYLLLVITTLSSGQNGNIEILGRWGEGGCEAVEIDSNFIYMGKGFYVDIFEINPPYQFISRIKAPGFVNDLIKYENLLYIATEKFGLRIYDLNDILNPREMGDVLLPGTTHRIKLYKNHIYSANYGEGLRIINVEDPRSPFEAAYFNQGYFAMDFDISNDLLFLTRYSELASGYDVINIVEPSNPSLVKRVFSPIGGCIGIRIKGDNLFAIFEEWLFMVYSISDPKNPEIISTCEASGHELGINNEYAIILEYDQIKIVDISKADSILFVSSFQKPGDKKAIRIKENLLYISDSYAGLIILNISDINNPVIEHHFPSPGATEDLVVDSNYIYISNHGLRIIDASEPNEPLVIGEMTTFYGTNNIEKNGNIVFLVDGNIGGLRIVDVRNKTHPVELSQIIPGNNLITSIASSGNYLYLAQGDSLTIWDISNPQIPFQLNSISTNGYIYEILLLDTILVTSQSGGGIVSYNISYGSNPTIIGSVVPSLTAIQISISGNNLICGTFNGFLIIDYSNPSNPVEIINYPLDWYTYDVKSLENFIYIAQAEEGLKIIDISDRMNPNIVGTYNTSGFAVTVATLKDKFYIGESRNGVVILRNNLLSNISDNLFDAPRECMLNQNYPNPFNPSTSIQYSISSAQFVTLKVFDLLGREVATLVNEEKPAGTYNAQFTMNNVQLSSGIYFYKLQAGSFVETKKMILLK